jgi:hypothetical protein
MKSEHRHQLQQNELAGRLEGGIEWAKRNSQTLAGVVVGIAVTLGLFYYLKNRWQEGAVAGWNEFFSAAGQNDTSRLETLATREGNELPGQMANLMLADTAYNNGVELMNTDRTGAEEQLNAAKNKYAQVRSGATNPLVRQRTTLGLARYYEAVGLLDEATKEYENLVKEAADGPYAEIARQKIVYLSEPATKAFATWYREHKPLPPASPLGTGMPDLGDFGKLPPDEKSFSSPSAAATGTAASPSATPSATK